MVNPIFEKNIIEKLKEKGAIVKNCISCGIEIITNDKNKKLCLDCED